MSEQQQLSQFKSHLNLIKSMTGDKAQQQFYQLMSKAKNTFGDLHLYMAQLYFEYAKFLLEKMQKNIDIFNSNMLPKQQENAAPEQNPINEDILQDDSSAQNQSQKPKSENNVNVGATASAIKTKEDEQFHQQPIITQDDYNKQLNGHDNNKGEQQNGNKEQKQEGQEAGQADGDDDFQICADNLLTAIKIFENQRDKLKNQGQQSLYSLGQVSRWISRCKSRLGDLYHLSQNYTQAVNTYRQVIHDQQQKQGHESNRGLAQIHYMIANSFLYQNKEGCQKVAIKQFLASVKILLNNLSLLNPQDTTVYQVPSQQKIKVDRFAYLPKSTDSEQVKQIKQVISCLLDKLQDTYEQIGIRAQYEEEKKKKKQQQEQNKFKEVSPDVPVIKLGTFGNRKKKAEDLPDQQVKKRNS